MNHRGLTLFEILIVCSIFIITATGVFVTYSRFLIGRSIDGVTERLVNLIRTAQSKAIEEEKIQAIFLSKNSILWVAYADKTMEELTGKCDPYEGEQVRMHEFKDNVKIAELWLDEEIIEPVPKEPEEGIAILIDEKGLLTKATITLALREETQWIQLIGREVKVKGEESDKLSITSSSKILELSAFEPSEGTAIEEAIICKTEGGLVRGWQTVTINNVDKVDEIRLRIKADIRMPASSHYHVYVFPQKYETKRIARGTDNRIKVVSLFHGHIYDESGQLVADYILGAFQEEELVREDPNGASQEGEYELLDLPHGMYTFKVETENYPLKIVPQVIADYEHTYLDITLSREQPSSGLYQEEQVGANIPLGDWDASHQVLVENSISANILTFNIPKLFYLYKGKSELQTKFITEYPTIGTPEHIIYNHMNIDHNNHLDLVCQNNLISRLRNTGRSNFPIGVVQPGGWWGLNNISSKLASQPLHNKKLKEEEIRPADYTNWFTIQTKELPAGTSSLRIAVASYHNENEKDMVFNLYPSSNAKHPENILETNELDYQTDPYVVAYPWLSWQNYPLWLSNYGYMLKPLTRPSSNNILATRGPYYGENYEDGEPYKKFWYGPVFLDWDKLLGEEGILWLLGWVSGTFGYDGYNNWTYSQYGDTYHPLHSQNYFFRSYNTAPAHYWLKSFAMLSYWYLFNYSCFYPPEDVLPLSRTKAKRIQLPLNLLTQEKGKFFDVWEQQICTPPPNESSSLSIRLMNEPRYPTWMPALAPIFGQNKIICSPDLYSSYYYVMQRINHIMLDTALWFYAIGNNNQQLAAYRTWNPTWNQEGISSFIGNFDKWRVELTNTSDRTNRPYPRATWWSWYQTIPWTKGAAFPMPSSLASREGWETPVVEAPPSDNLFATGNNPNPIYNNILRNQPNTIFMSTAHYPLGSIQITVKKK